MQSPEEPGSGPIEAKVPEGSPTGTPLGDYRIARDRRFGSSILSVPKITGPDGFVVDTGEEVEVKVREDRSVSVKPYVAPRLQRVGGELKSTGDVVTVPTGERTRVRPVEFAEFTDQPVGEPTARRFDPQTPGLSEDERSSILRPLAEEKINGRDLIDQMRGLLDTGKVNNDFVSMVCRTFQANPSNDPEDKELVKQFQDQIRPKEQAPARRVTPVEFGRPSEADINVWVTRLRDEVEAVNLEDIDINNRLYDVELTTHYKEVGDNIVTYLADILEGKDTPSFDPDLVLNNSADLIAAELEQKGSMAQNRHYINVGQVREALEAGVANRLKERAWQEAIKGDEPYELPEEEFRKSINAGRTEAARQPVRSEPEAVARETPAAILDLSDAGRTALEISRSAAEPVPQAQQEVAEPDENEPQISTLLQRIIEGEQRDREAIGQARAETVVSSAVTEPAHPGIVDTRVESRPIESGSIVQRLAGSPEADAIEARLAQLENSPATSVAAGTSEVDIKPPRVFVSELADELQNKRWSLREYVASRYPDEDTDKTLKFLIEKEIPGAFSDGGILPTEQLAQDLLPRLSPSEREIVIKQIRQFRSGKTNE